MHLTKKQKLAIEIEQLKKQKDDMNFVIEYEKKINQAVSAKKELEKKYKALQEKNQELESQIDNILEVDNFKLSKNIWVPSKHIRNAVGIANVLISDGHVEERVDKEEMSGKNEYNPQIAEKRMKRLFITCQRLVDIERYATDINVLVIWLLGDMISGWIHEEFLIDNFKTPPEATLFCEQLLYDGLNYLLKYGKYEKIIVIGKPGNHSRITNKPHFSNAMAKTHEWTLYHMLAKTYERLNNSKIEFIIPRDYSYIYNEFDFKIRGCHGDSFKYNGGIGGASVSINRGLLRANKTDVVYLDVFGHLHMYEGNKNYICNGSIIGFNQRAKKMNMEFDVPKQAFFVIERRLGLIINRPIYVDFDEDIEKGNKKV